MNRAFWPLGTFGRTYALMLACVLLAETLVFVLLIVTKPPIPPLVSFDDVVTLLENPAARVNAPVQAREQANWSASDRPDAKASLLIEATARATGVPVDRLDAKVDASNPAPIFGPQNENVVREGERPAFLVGEFSIAMRTSSGKWRVVATDGSFRREARNRAVLLLGATFIVVLPFAFLLAQRVTRPVKRFAIAADRLGRSLEAEPIEMVGPLEIQVVAQALNSMQQRIARFVRDRTTMVSAMAHDLRTPLMRLSFQLEAVEEPLRSKLERQVLEMREKINAVLNYMRDERSRGLDVPVDLVSVVQAVCENAQEAGEDVTFKEGGKATVLGDAIGLRSVFENLVGNALRYGGSARVSLRASRTHVDVTVADDGPGIPPEDIEHVFEPFVRGDKARGGQGVGLGLTLVRSVVEAHGGSIELRNTGRGLNAVVRLPLALGRP